MAEENNKVKELKEKLFYNPKHSVLKMSDAEIAAADSFAEGYMNFLDAAKTEREAVAEAISLAKANGYEEYVPGTFYAPGAKIYYNNRNKSIILAVVGTKGLSKGAKIIAAHIDSPRLDLKPNPLYEKEGLGYFKTHYYGGIKKYQWTAIPLSLHGVVVKADGTCVSVNVGEDAGDPKFVISDLLPHLAGEQMARTLAQGIKGEDLNLLIGSRPFDKSDEAQNVKLNILNILNEKYGITEPDFQSAELEIVPAFRACDIGFDRSMIGGYGHDDRVCSYPALIALLDSEQPEHTALCVLTDKEEIGSVGNTGLHSAYMTYFIKALADAEGLDGEAVLSQSECLSADVNAAYDPDFPEVYERNNSSLLNNGVVITKYTGSRGKGGSSDASAEFMGKIRKMLDEANVCWQTGELGKVDAGGGGTVAQYVAAKNIDVVDVGVPVLSMHAPFEVVSKLDVYSAYRAFVEFYKS